MTAGRFNTRALHDALAVQRQLRALSWARVAEQTGVSAATLRRTAQGGPMELDGIRAMVRWLGDGAPPDASVQIGLLLGAQQPQLSPEDAAALAYIVRISLRPGRFAARALHAAVNVERAARHLSWGQVAGEIGLAPGQLTRTARGGRMEVNGMLAMVAWLGFPAAADDFTHIPATGSP